MSSEIDATKLVEELESAKKEEKAKAKAALKEHLDGVRAEYEDLKDKELKQELEQRELSTKGKKKDLVERLLSAAEQDWKDAEAQRAAEAKAAAAAEEEEEEEDGRSLFGAAFGLAKGTVKGTVAVGKGTLKAADTMNQVAKGQPRKKAERAAMEAAEEEAAEKMENDLFK